MPTKSCYIIASWGGPRRKAQHPGLQKDGTLYLREHVGRVLSYRKCIGHVIVVAPRGDGFYKGYEEYLAELEKLHETDGVVIEVLRRDNVGLSYGSLNDAFGKHRTNFDYYFIAEDDYIPVVPDFDQILIRMLEDLPGCGFLCALVWMAPGRGHMCSGIFLGIMRAAALEKIWLKNGFLARFTGNTYGEAEECGQIGISNAIREAGYDIADWTKDYSSPFWETSSIRNFVDSKRPPMYVPAQTLQISEQKSTFKERKTP